MAEPITAEEFNRLLFDLRDRLWAGSPPTEPEPPLRLAGWRGRVYDLLGEALDLTGEVLNTQ